MSSVWPLSVRKHETASKSQSFNCESHEPVMARRESKSKARAKAGCLGVLMVSTQMLWSKSHSLKVQSWDPLKAYCAAQSTATFTTPSAWPFKVCSHVPLSMSQSFNMQSVLPVIARCLNLRTNFSCGGAPTRSIRLVASIISSSSTSRPPQKRPTSRGGVPDNAATRSLTSLPRACSPSVSFHECPLSIATSTWTPAASESQQLQSCRFTWPRSPSSSSRAAANRLDAVGSGLDDAVSPL
mmetsp:Transcript_85631/g.239179  ORF Transcript_85631/g.239179 Transcript_85631/m.239179 type:complete len:241 (+) Transcript_85631:756-1478(+)